MKRILACLLALALLLGILTGCSKSDSPRTSYDIPSDPYSLDLPEEGVGVEYGTPTVEPSSVPAETEESPETTANKSDTLVQLTMEDIQRMNGDSTVIDIYTNEGYLSTLVGKYYEGKIRNAEDGVESVKAMASLLGLTKGCEFFAVYSEKDNNNGYTYYTYQQRYGQETLQYATLRIAVDPDGYTAGLTCSFVPNVGTASQESGVSQQEAETLALQKGGTGLKLVSGRTIRLAATLNNVVYNVWVVYTNNPDLSPSFDMPYLAHYIKMDGSYVMAIPCSTFASDNKEIINNDAYFEDLTTQNVTFTVAQAIGGTKQITVPISKNKNDGKYYLMDPSRKIAVAQYWDFYFRDTFNFVSSTSQNSGWQDRDLMAYYNYIKIYDCYAKRGIRSVDGFETPILITVGYCDQNKNPVNNACFYGINAGWACFAASSANNYAYCADVCGHEFTHGVTANSMQGIYYQNETGAINEAYSDIMGNLCEKIAGESSDPGWMIAENAYNGQTRNMADPNSRQQPAYVGDRYYVAPVLNPNTTNDRGGIHDNNSLVSHLAYLLDRDGMTLEDQFTMWLTSIELLTPKSNYEDLHGILLFSLKINGLLKAYGPTVNKAFEEIGLNENPDMSYLSATKSGFGRITFQTDGYTAASNGLALIATPDGNVIANAYPDRNGVVSLLVPAGTYIIAYKLIENNGSSSTMYRYNGSIWSPSAPNFGNFSVLNGSVTTLPAFNSGRSVEIGSGGSGTGQEKPSGSSLNLVSYNGGYFTIMIPEGWRIETDGAYSAFSYKIYDPQNPSRLLFMFGQLAPYHKSEASRQYFSYFDTTGGLLTNGPVLTTHDVGGILDCWDYCIEYQRRYDGKVSFPTLNNIDLFAVGDYDGPNQGYGIDSVGLATCTDASGTLCGLSMAAGLVDMDFYNLYNGNWYYTCFGMVGLLLPIDEYEDLMEDLLTCPMTLQFSQDYINASQNTGLALADNATIARNFEITCSGIMDFIDEEG
ncbi:MAG: M4 family metallopeptidase [Clostridia bacterium]|nr:M4 family metallopeptidase [Clostridia bacterium]